MYPRHGKKRPHLEERSNACLVRSCTPGELAMGLMSSRQTWCPTLSASV